MLRAQPFERLMAVQTADNAEALDGTAAIIKPFRWLDVTSERVVLDILRVRRVGIVVARPLP